jgi:hypothetical protein
MDQQQAFFPVCTGNGGIDDCFFALHAVAVTLRAVCAFRFRHRIIR